MSVSHKLARVDKHTNHVSARSSCSKSNELYPCLPSLNSKWQKRGKKYSRFCLEGGREAQVQYHALRKTSCLSFTFKESLVLSGFELALFWNAQGQGLIIEPLHYHFRKCRFDSNMAIPLDLYTAKKWNCEFEVHFIAFLAYRCISYQLTHTASESV